MIDKFMYDYENKSNLEKYDIRFSKSYVKDFILYTLFTLIKPEGKTILDCPGSTGYVTKLLIDKGAKYVICSDIVKEQIEYAEHRLNINNVDRSKYKLIVHDAKEPSLLDIEVDIAVVMHLYCFANDFEEMIDISNFLYTNLVDGGKLYTLHCTPINEGKEDLYESLYNSKIIERKRKNFGEFIVTNDNGFILPRNMYDNDIVIDALDMVGFKDIKLHRCKISPFADEQEEIELNHEICDYYFIEATK